MKDKKIVFVIPGFGHKPSNKGYKTLSKLLQADGHRAIPVTIPWKNSTIIQNTKYFLEEYKKRVSVSQRKKSNIYLLGFSYGALIAFLASTKIPVKGLILCSLSPYFKEDLQKLPKNPTLLQKRRHESFSSLTYRSLAKKIKAKQVLMLYGEKESTLLIKRSVRTFDNIPTNGKFLLSIKKTEHNIADKKYLTAIHYATKNFL